MTITEKKDCRLCGARVQPVFALSPTPIANQYASAPDAGATRYPLELCQCSSCGHVQTRHVLSGLFVDYKYQTPAIVAKHLQPSAAKLRERFPEAQSVLEIGSNNGVFLECLRREGFYVQGIDPCATGLDNEIGYFSAAWARWFVDKYQEQFDLVVANNVLAHIDDLQDVFEGIGTILKPGGALVFENQYFPALVEAGTYDQLYHEHVSCHTLVPLPPFLARHGFTMTDVEFIPTHGGSIRITAQSGGPRAHFNEEPIDWGAFTKRVNDITTRLRKRLWGRKVVALGAAAKACTLINHCGIADRILFACDDTPEKIGRYIPGTDIQIRPTSEMGDFPALATAWNYLDVFREKFPRNEIISPYEEVTAEAQRAA